jgi:hypothetical protein
MANTITIRWKILQNWCKRSHCVSILHFYI